MILCPIHETNDCHSPAGGPAGGQFCSTGAAKTLAGVTVAPHPDAEGRYTLKSEQGWVELSTSKRYGGPHLAVSNIRVFDEFRGQGYGQALYLAAVKAAKEIGKNTWPRYRGVYSSPELRSESASKAWEGLKRRYPKRVKRVRDRGKMWEVME